MNYELYENIEHVPDGVWDISDLEFIKEEPPRTKKYNKKTIKWEDIPNAKELLDDFYEKRNEFIKKYPNYVVANAYETEYPFLISKMPTKKINYVGSGFNYGSNNIIDNCPKRILICAQND